MKNIKNKIYKIARILFIAFVLFQSFGNVVWAADTTWYFTSTDKSGVTTNSSNYATSSLCVDSCKNAALDQEFTITTCYQSGTANTALCNSGAPTLTAKAAVGSCMKKDTAATSEWYYTSATNTDVIFFSKPACDKASSLLGKTNVCLKKEITDPLLQKFPYSYSTVDNKTNLETEFAYATQSECETNQANDTKIIGAVPITGTPNNPTAAWHYSITDSDGNENMSPTNYDSFENCEIDRKSAIATNKNVSDRCTNQEPYALLAPIGNLKTIQTNNIGKYFNLMFNLMIGLCGALSVIMLVINGIKYMGAESVFGKEDGKKGIGAAIFGLLIALGSYAILNTINPDLLGEKGLSITPVDIILEGVGVATDPNAPPAPSGAGMQAWVNQYGKELTMTLKDGSAVKVKPCDTASLVDINKLVSNKDALGNVTGLFDLPKTRQFLINKYLVEGLKRVDSQWRLSGKIPAIKTYDGSYIGCVTANKNGKVYIPFHAYGMAVDFNAQTNMPGVKGDMPANFVGMWKNENWVWGGDWNPTDPMHFSMGESKINGYKIVGETPK